MKGGRLMLVDIKKITKALQKITDFTSGDKTIPGVMFDLVLEDGVEPVEAGADGSAMNPPADEDTNEPAVIGPAILKVCYSDGHKSLVEVLEATAEQGDTIGRVITDYGQLKRAIDNCQSSGSIIVDDFRIVYEKNVLKVCARQYYNITDGEGNVTAKRYMGEKSMDISRTEPEADMKAKVLTRANYDNIFTAEQFDQYDRAELADALARTSTEKGKQIYFAQSRQEVFVTNQAHVTSYPISLYDVSEQDMLEIRGELAESNPGYTEEDYAKLIKDKRNRIHFSLVFSQQTAKAVSSIISKLESDTVYISKSDNKFCSVYVDNDDEKVGIWFEMPAASKAHLGGIERYSSLPYTTYQISFMREFITDIVKSALSSTKSEKVALKFETNEVDSIGRPLYELVVDSGSASASTSDRHRLNADDAIDTLGDLADKSFNISLKVLYDMLAQLKTVRVAFDINIGEADTVCIRVAEIDDAKNQQEYDNARQDVKDGEPTPVERKLAYRVNTLGVKQFTTLSK